MFGVLNINKPSGWTSRDAVNRVQKLVRPHKVGHAGTLDPLATGVLVVCVGRATRLIDYVQQVPKQYLATFLLGRTSASDDIDTDVTELAGAPVPMLSDIELAIPRFLGTISQAPPAYSAVKIEGQRAYALARQGMTVTIAPRPVEIYEIRVIAYEYPLLKLRIECGSGTYVRSLGRDLAESLGTAAVMSELTRSRIGIFTVEEAMAIDELSLERLKLRLQPPNMAVSHLPEVRLTDEQVAELRYGRAIPSDRESECAGIDEHGNLIAILRPKLPGLLKPHINLASSA